MREGGVELNPILARFLRAFIAVILAGLAQNYGGHPYWLVIAPVLMALGKWLRDAFKWDWIPV